MRILLLALLGGSLALMGCEKKEETPEDTLKELGKSFKEKSSEMADEIKEAADKHSE